MSRLVELGAALLLLMAIGSRNGRADELRKITINDLYSIPSCSDPRISPDGKQVVFGLHTSDPSTNEEQDHLWIMNSDGSESRQLTYGSSNQWRPRWTPDGKNILFLSDREEGNQVWILPMNGGEAHKMTSIPTSVSEYELFPDGHRIILVTRVFPQCQSDSCNKAALEKAENDRDRPRLYDKLLYRHYNRWADGRVNRIFIADIEKPGASAIYRGNYDAPTSFLGGDRDYAVSPDGKEICFAMTTDSMPAVWPNNNLYLASMPRQDAIQFTNGPGLETTPRYSPDGNYLSYLGTVRAGYESDQRDLMIYDRNTRKTVNISHKFDCSINDYFWDPKSQFIYFTGFDRGLSKIWRVNINSGEIEQILGDAVYGDLQISPAGDFVIVSRSLSDQPNELYRYDIESRKLSRLTHFTDNDISNLRLSKTEEFWFIGALGDSVEGFLTKPPDFDSNKKYPLLLLIHGGPQFCWLQNFNYYGWNTQLMAAQGYVAAQINPHGSAGYGLKFQEYVSGNWGKGDYDDLMMGVDYIIKRYPFVDSTRMAALGRSYGGFMVDWICGHTDRFKCLISIDGTYNHISEYGSTDELWFPEWEYKGTPWSNRDEYIRSSPATYAQNFKTPTMLIHGQNDYRVDLSEGLQMFTTLQRMGVPSEILYYPAEGHSAGRLDDLRITYDKQFEWLARWLK